MAEWFRLSKQETMSQLLTGGQGLSSREAKERLKQYGENVIQESGRKQWWQVFLEQFKDLLVIILIVAAGISMVTGDPGSAGVIFAVLLLNAVLGTVQHQRAEKSLDSLKSLSSPEARVRRDGRQMDIPSSEVVPGDILLLEAGDLVAADARLIEVYGLQVNESSLTGESLNVDKQETILGRARGGERGRGRTGAAAGEQPGSRAGSRSGDRTGRRTGAAAGEQPGSRTVERSGAPTKDAASQIALADRVNMVFCGSLVTGGRGVAVVTGTGMDTEIGKIAALMNDTQEHKTPLQVSLDRFSGRLAAAIMAISAVVFGLSLYRKEPVLDALMFAVALAVAAIPEALSSIVTIVQAMGTQKMAKEHAIIKDLKAVESLGCVSVICSDKTGTLTQNRMEVEYVCLNHRERSAEWLKENTYRPDVRLLLYGAVLDNDASADPDGQASRDVGEPMELALLHMAAQAGVVPEQVRRRFPRTGELPFDPRRKLMSTQNQLEDGVMVFVKGALDVLLDRCTQIANPGSTQAAVPPAGRAGAALAHRTLTDQDRRRIMDQNLKWSSQGLRVLAFACKPEEKGKAAEQNLIFLGMAAMMDPPRSESRAAVQNARRAGIRTVMITGDHKVTAMAIAGRIGIMDRETGALTGAELNAMDDAELDRRLEQTSVYARVSPEHKIRIVSAWQRRGRIVAMTGDGVNDAPALKKADIGVAMGITGTEVSKDAASMILADDNFATIIKAVANGRNVYRNIKNAIQFLLSGNMAGILCVLYTSLAALPMPFAPVHLLFINLLTDSLPAIAIGMEPPEEGLLKESPRNPREGILTKNFVRDILIQGGLIALATMWSYRTGLGAGGEALASTMAFSTLTLARLFHGFNCRSRHSVLRLGLGSNLYSVMAFELGVVLLAAVLFVPGLQMMFAAADLSVYQLLTVGFAAFAPTLVIQAFKTFRECLE